ncbi:Putative ATP-binding cassette, subfamily D (ALD), member 3 [Rhizopus microsporus]|nr:Putative ATP-binding cassette, subfamily D (ALD), member 3 [Rhizopus microsporus]
MTAYYLLARPVFDPRYATKYMGADHDPTKLMEDYSRNSSYLINLSQAVGRLILTGRDLTRFAGYTSRVAELFEVLTDVHQGKYKRTMMSNEEGSAGKNKIVDTTNTKGKVLIRDGVIVFDNVPIVTPNSDILVKDLSFKVSTGMNCLISGPNGCGKSSLFRILGDLWPLFGKCTPTPTHHLTRYYVGGTVTKPEASKLFYVPQKPYLPLGTFRDQVIYPDTQKEAFAKGYNDEELMKLLDTVHLGYLVEREGGWDAVHDWADVLSGGEKQRVAMARLFYHKPQFAILDECTSAVSVDIEALMYEHARKVGITLFTVTSLIRHHEYLLRFDGEGHYEFREMDPEDINSAFGFGHGKSKPQEKLQDNAEEEDFVGLFSKESGLLFVLATVLIARTWLDIWFSGFNGQVVKAIVSRDRKEFIARAIVEFGLMMWPMSIVNNSLKLTINALALSFRQRLTKHAHDQYLDDCQLGQ